MVQKRDGTSKVHGAPKRRGRPRAFEPDVALGKAMTAAVRSSLDDPTLVDPRKYLAPARAAMTAVVAHVLTVLAR